MKLSVLWSAPDVNPVNQKARSIPVLNPINRYGRVFTFSWFGFFIAFWSWYAWPPLLSVTIKKDLNLSTTQIANSNIAALTGTLLVRFFAGPLCDAIGPRWTFISILLAGSIPTAMAGAESDMYGYWPSPSFVGILGGTFVPCQVWSTGFFDKNIVGTSNALIGGWGNAGGGITYFLMPQIFDSLVYDQGLRPHVAWRVAFIVPFILIVSTAVGMIFFCDDTPTGKWSERRQTALTAAEEHVDKISSTISEAGPDRKTADLTVSDPEKRALSTHHSYQKGIIDSAEGEVIVAPTLKNTLHVIMSPQTLFHCVTYFCSFGGELAINSYLGAYYLKNFPTLGQTGSGRWAAMFGLLNVVTRPLGGVVADVLYKYTSSLWVKKLWIVFVGVISGAFLIAIGLTDPKSEATMYGLIAAMAVFLEAGNGANFGLVPHVHPMSNGVLSGTVGAVGNLGGVIFAIVFRYHGTNYAESLWIIGVIIIGLNLVLCWVRPT